MVMVVVAGYDTFVTMAVVILGSILILLTLLPFRCVFVILFLILVPTPAPVSENTNAIISGKKILGDDVAGFHCLTNSIGWYRIKTKSTNNNELLIRKKMRIINTFVAAFRKGFQERKCVLKYPSPCLPIIENQKCRHFCYCSFYSRYA